jgi:hypothetical protein
LDLLSSNLPISALDAGLVEKFSGTSTSRTLMLPELRTLLANVPASATATDYREAVVESNVLSKPTLASRTKTASYLRDRFALDPNVTLFRALRELWDADPEAQPLLAMLAAVARDPVLRSTAPTVLSYPESTHVSWPMLADVIEQRFPGKLTFKTLRSTAQNVNAAWTQSGHLKGSRQKHRVRASSRPTAVAYALLLGYLCGKEGDALFDSIWVEMLDAPQHVVREQAAKASGAGWITYKHGGGVTEVGFRHLLQQGA